MPKASRDALQAKGKTDVFFLDPEKVKLVEDEKALLYDERVKAPVDEDLVVNIMYAPDGKTPQGVLEPILARRNPETGDVECIDGRNRVRANREANKRLKKMGLPQVWIPTLLKRADDSRLFAMLVSSNEHRTDDSPMNRAKKAQRFIDLGHGEKEVAVLLGTSEATVKNLLRLLDAPAVVRNAVDAGKITTSDGYKLAREEPEVAKKKLAKLMEHAPRVPGKKRSPNAKKAREIMGGKPAAPPEPAPAPAPAADASLTSAVEFAKKAAKKIEDAAAEAIAVWIENTWNDGNWAGAPSDIPILIRRGEWRKPKEGGT